MEAAFGSRLFCDVFLSFFDEVLPPSLRTGYVFVEVVASAFSTKMLFKAIFEGCFGNYSSQIVPLSCLCLIVCIAVVFLALLWLLSWLREDLFELCCVCI